MIVAERARTGSHRWENDWCPKCKERMTFWYVSETRTRCAMCAAEKDKSRGLGLGPEPEEAPAPAAEAPAPPPPPPPAPVVEPPPREPVWLLSWCSECRYNASFMHEHRETFRCMSCGMTKLLPGVEPPKRG